MALVITALSADLKKIFDAMEKEEYTTGQLADEMAAAFDNYMKSADVITTVTGVATGALAGGPGVPVTANGKGNLK